ncbi:MAG: hypothetical protein HY961_11200 [Ignavibacteriae bacterium]|nr:hypothetical protein [Ignavibacteriota bacterium]
MVFDYSPYAFVVLAVLGAITAYGIFASRRGIEKTSVEYFLGSRSLSTLEVGSSLFATGIAGLSIYGAFIGGTDESWLWYCALAVVAALILGFSFAPTYLSSRVLTVPGFFSLRFDERTAVTLSGLSIFFSVAVKIPLLLMFASWAIKNVFGWNTATSAGLVLVVVLIGLYTIVGGFSSVVRTHVLEAGIILVGIAAAATSTLVNSGRVLSVTTSCLMPDVSVSFAVGILIVFTWHWWFDQFTVQRILAARNIPSARRGAVLCAILIGVAVLLVGISSSMRGSSVAALVVSGDLLSRSIGSVVVLALLMATLASEFQSTATLFTLDFYKRLYADASEESLVLVGRLSTTLIVVLAIVAGSTISLVDERSETLLLQVPLHIVPPIVAVFGFSLFWQRASNKGALCALLCGELFGAVSLIARYVSGSDAWGGMPVINLFTLDPFVFGLISLLCSALILVAVSLLTEAPPLETTTYMSILRRKQN